MDIHFYFYDALPNQQRERELGNFSLLNYVLVKWGVLEGSRCAFHVCWCTWVKLNFKSFIWKSSVFFFFWFKIFIYLFFNLFFIGVQFTNIQNNPQCPSPIHSHPLPSSPSTTPSSFSRVSSLYVLSPFLIFPTHFFPLPLYSLSLLFIFPKWMRTYTVCPSPTDLLHSA